MTITTSTPPLSTDFKEELLGEISYCLEELDRRRFERQLRLNSLDLEVAFDPDEVMEEFLDSTTRQMLSEIREANPKDFEIEQALRCLIENPEATFLKACEVILSQAIPGASKHAQLKI